MLADPAIREVIEGLFAPLDPRPPETSADRVKAILEAAGMSADEHVRLARDLMAAADRESARAREHFDEAMAALERLTFAEFDLQSARCRCSYVPVDDAAIAEDELAATLAEIRALPEVDR